MPTGKFNVGRGLLRLYLVVWMLIVAASLIGGHREVMTYLGSTYWSAEKVWQRKKDEFQKRIDDCKSEDCKRQLRDQQILDLEDPPITDLVESDDAKSIKESVELLAILVLAVPAALLLVLVVIFKLLAWAIAGFKTN